MRSLAARVAALNRVDAVWLATEPIDMRAGTETALARVLKVFAVIDLFSRQVVGWSLRGDMPRDIVIDALRMAWFKLHPGKGRLDLSQRLGAVNTPVLTSWPCSKTGASPIRPATKATRVFEGGATAWTRFKTSREAKDENIGLLPWYNALGWTRRWARSARCTSSGTGLPIRRCKANS